MSEARFNIERSGHDVRAKLIGRWEESDAAAFDEALRAELQAAGQSCNLIIDLTDLSECRILARGKLADVMTELKEYLRRSAWIARSPRMRGLALWVLHVAEDPQGRPVRDEAQARAWIDSDGERFESALERLERSVKASGGAG